MARPEDPTGEDPAGAATAVWERLGNTTNFVEPFGLGLFTVLLTRPVAHRWWERFESINDPRGGMSNLFRAFAAEPDQTAAAFAAADRQPPELPQTMDDRLRADPFWHDSAAAGRWASAVTRPLRTPGSPLDHAVELRALTNRLRRVRAASGKWQRLVGRPSKTAGRNITAVLMDPAPPAADEDRDDRRQALDWSLEHGSDPRYRIAYIARSDEEPALRAAGWDRQDDAWYSPRCAPAGHPEDPELVARAPKPDPPAKGGRSDPG